MELIELLGERIQNHRKSLKFSLDELSIRSGVSKSMLSQIEQGKANPTVTVAIKIAKALKINIQDLLEEEKEIIFQVIKKKDITTLSSSDNSCLISVITPVDFIEKIELYSLEFAKNGILTSKPHHPNTEEFFTVTKGDFQVVASNRSVNLTSGDSVRFQADVVHSIKNLSTRPSTGILLVKYTD